MSNFFFQIRGENTFVINMDQVMNKVCHQTAELA